MKRTERTKQWVKHIEQWRSSGLTQRAYCTRESIGYATFKRWRGLLRDGNSGRGRMPRFVPVQLGGAGVVRPVAPYPVGQSGNPMIGHGVEIRLLSGRVIALSRHYDEVDLARLIRMLEVLPC